MAVQLSKRNPVSPLKTILWKLKTASTKKYILTQDQLGLYSYQDWIRDQEPSSKELAEQLDLCHHLPYQPLISILIWTSGSTAYHIDRTYESLAKQTYPKWEACLIRSTHQDQDWNISLLTDQRVRIQELSESSKSWNAWATLLGMAQGEYIQTITPGDLLSPRTLYEAAKSLNETPEVDILYFDEDQVSEASTERDHPLFKPDWSPELMLSLNYLYGAVFRSSLLQRVTEQLAPEDCTIGEVAFRCIEQTHRVHHIPHVLYHRLCTDSGTQTSPKSDQHLASVASHLVRRGIQYTKASRTQNGDVHIAWPDLNAPVSIIIPTKDKVGFLRHCLNSIQQRTAYKNYEIVLVDSGSIEPSTHHYYAELQQLPNILRVDFSGKFNFNKVLNLGAKHAQGEVLLFLNNDTEVIDADWLSELAGWAIQPEIGIVGAKLLYPDLRIQHAGIVVGMEGHGSHIFAGTREGYSGIFGSVDWYRDYSAVTGACMATRREVFEKIGGFDEQYDLVFSDIEFCLRAIHAGYRVVYNPFARLIHHEGKTRHRLIPTKDYHLAYQHLKTIVASGDPFYNPNLSYSVRLPTFKRPNEEIPIKRLESIVQQKADP